MLYLYEEILLSFLSKMYIPPKSNNNNNNVMTSFSRWGSTASRLEPLQGGSLLFTTKFLEIGEYCHICGVQIAGKRIEKLKVVNFTCAPIQAILSSPRQRNTYSFPMGSVYFHQISISLLGRSQLNCERSVKITKGI